MFIAHMPLMLAETSPNLSFVGSLVLAGGIIIGTLTNGLMCYFMGRRTPPLAEQLHRDFLPRTEFNETRNKRDAEVDANLQRLHSRIDGVAAENISAAIARGTLITKMEAMEEKQDETNRWLHQFIPRTPPPS